MLLAQFESPVVKLEDVCNDYFGLTRHEANRKAALNKLPVPTFRLSSSQRAPRMVHLQDLADFIDMQRKNAITSWGRSNSV
jgi:hypothetical protein